MATEPPDPSTPVTFRLPDPIADFLEEHLHDPTLGQALMDARSRREDGQSEYVVTTYMALCLLAEMVYIEDDIRNGIIPSPVFSPEELANAHTAIAKAAGE